MYMNNQMEYGSINESQQEFTYEMSKELVEMG